VSFVVAVTLFMVCPRHWQGDMPADREHRVTFVAQLQTVIHVTGVLQHLSASVRHQRSFTIMSSVRLQQGARAAVKQHNGSVVVRAPAARPAVRAMQQASGIAAAASTQSATQASSRSAQRVVRTR
jgi:hypothetical protein